MAQFELNSMPQQQIPPESHNLPRHGLVTDVRREWLVHEDQALAYRLQNEEYSQHLGHNRSRNAILRHDTPHAREEQVKVDEEAARHHQRMLREMDEQEARDAAVAAEVASRLEAEERRQREELEHKDMELARQMAATERARVKERKELRQVEREAAYLGINTGQDNVALLAAQTDTGPSAGEAPVPRGAASGGGRSHRPPPLSDADLTDLSDFCLQPSEGMGEEEARRLQEEQDAEVARLLGDQEVKRRGDCLPKDQLLAIQAQDQELAKVLQEQERAKARKAREKARQKALQKKQLKRQQQHQRSRREALADADEASTSNTLDTGRDTATTDKYSRPLPALSPVNITASPVNTASCTSTHDDVTSSSRDRHGPPQPYRGHRRNESEHFYDTPDDDLTRPSSSDDTRRARGLPFNREDERCELISISDRLQHHRGGSSTPYFQSSYSQNLVDPYACERVSDAASVAMRLPISEASPPCRTSSPRSHNTTLDSSFDDMGHHYDTPSLLLAGETAQAPTSPPVVQPSPPLRPSSIASPPLSYSPHSSNGNTSSSRPRHLISPASSPHDLLRFARSPATSPLLPILPPQSPDMFSNPPHHRAQSSIVSNASSTASQHSTGGRGYRSNNQERILNTSHTPPPYVEQRLDSPVLGSLSAWQQNLKHSEDPRPQLTSNISPSPPANVSNDSHAANGTRNAISPRNNNTNSHSDDGLSFNSTDTPQHPNMSHSNPRKYLDISHTPNTRLTAAHAQKQQQCRRSVAEVMGELQRIKVTDYESLRGSVASDVDDDVAVTELQPRSLVPHRSPQSRSPQSRSPSQVGHHLPGAPLAVSPPPRVPPPNSPATSVQSISSIQHLHSPRQLISPHSLHSQAPHSPSPHSFEQPASSSLLQYQPASSCSSQHTPSVSLSPLCHAPPQSPPSSSCSPIPPNYQQHQPQHHQHHYPHQHNRFHSPQPQPVTQQQRQQQLHQQQLYHQQQQQLLHQQEQQKRQQQSLQHHQSQEHSQQQFQLHQQQVHQQMLHQQEQQHAHHQQELQQQHELHQPVVPDTGAGSYPNIACAIDPTYQRRVMLGQLPGPHHHHHSSHHHHHHLHHHARLQQQQYMHQEELGQDEQQREHLVRLQQLEQRELLMEQQFHERMQHQLFLQQQQQLYQQSLESCDQYPAPPYMPIQGQRRFPGIEKPPPRLAELRGVVPSEGEQSTGRGKSIRGGGKQGAVCKQQ